MAICCVKVARARGRVRKCMQTIHGQTRCVWYVGARKKYAIMRSPIHTQTQAYFFLAQVRAAVWALLCRHRYGNLELQVSDASRGNYVPRIGKPVSSMPLLCNESFNSLRRKTTIYPWRRGYQRDGMHNPLPGATGKGVGNEFSQAEVCQSVVAFLRDDIDTSVYCA